MTNIHTRFYIQIREYPSTRILAAALPHTKDDIHKIESVQRRAARLVWGLFPYSSVTDMIGKLGWRNLEQQRSDSRLVLFYKIVYGYVAVPLPSYVIPHPRASRTPHPLAYRQISTRTDYYKYSFYPLTVVQWNSLPASIATLTDLNSFKRAVCQVCHPFFLFSFFLSIFTGSLIHEHYTRECEF